MDGFGSLGLDGVVYRLGRTSGPLERRRPSLTKLRLLNTALDPICIASGHHWWGMAVIGTIDYSCRMHVDFYDEVEPGQMSMLQLVPPICEYHCVNDALMLD